MKYKTVFLSCIRQISSTQWPYVWLVASLSDTIGIEDLHHSRKLYWTALL